jgi:hypothetical protein
MRFYFILQLFCSYPGEIMSIFDIIPLYNKLRSFCESGLIAPFQMSPGDMSPNDNSNLGTIWGHESSSLGTFWGHKLKFGDYFRYIFEKKLSINIIFN